MVVNAILYQARTGCQWRYLPAEFGRWNIIWKTFVRWRDPWVEAAGSLPSGGGYAVAARSGRQQVDGVSLHPRGMIGACG